MSIKTQETCKPVPPRWTTAKIQAEKRVCVLCVNPAICAVCAVLAVRSFNNLRWHNRGRGFESHPLRHNTVDSPQSTVHSQQPYQRVVRSHLPISSCRNQQLAEEAMRLDEASRYCLDIVGHACLCLM